MVGDSPLYCKVGRVLSPYRSVLRGQGTPSIIAYLSLAWSCGKDLLKYSHIQCYEDLLEVCSIVAVCI